MSKTAQLIVTVLAVLALAGSLLWWWGGSSALQAKHINSNAADVVVKPDEEHIDKKYTYICPNGKSIIATYHLPEDASVDVTLSDGRSFNLPHAISGSGARYAAAAETTVFWNKGNSAMVEENGTTTYENCITSQ